MVAITDFSTFYVLKKGLVRVTYQIQNQCIVSLLRKTTVHTVVQNVVYE